jgi:hypothetical protein
VKPADLLAEPLGDRIGIGRRMEVGADAGGIHQAGAVLAAALEQVQGGTGIRADGCRWIGAGAGGVRDPGEMEDRVTAGDEPARLRVAGIDPHGVELLRRGTVRAARSGGRDHLVSPLGEQHREAPAEEARRSGDQDPHESAVAEAAR